ncbi:MAG TPA: hypothetical protein VFE50_06310 [Cyclobacteriaceae bacterium]|nr:hypothetical protein [Cyclobacteriaceae bacterium]
MPLTINYHLDFHGWADLHVNHGQQRVRMTVSYLRDTLSELITAANLLLQGAQEAKVLAMDEPGEHLIYLQALPEGKLLVEIRWFKDWASWDIITEKEFQVVFKCEDTVLNFSTEVFENARRILEKEGVKRYREKWVENDFPVDGYNRLKLLLEK